MVEFPSSKAMMMINLLVVCNYGLKCKLFWKKLEVFSKVFDFLEHGQ